MKLLEKTIFKSRNEKIRNLESILENNTSYLKKVIQERNNLRADIDELNEIMAQLTDKFYKENAEKKKYSGKCGGLTKQINKLTAENNAIKMQYDKLKAEFDEFKKGKYIVKELKAEKMPRRRQVMGVRSAQLTSNIIAKIKPSEEKVD